MSDGIKQKLKAEGINIELGENERDQARLNILHYLNQKDEDQSLSMLIKEIALRGASCRFIAEKVYPESHYSHGDQMSGRDLKRWAALELEELFEDLALVDIFKSGTADYWHEY